jgi:hypothetical protein
LFEIAMMVSRWVDREAAKAEERLAHGQTPED